jgi:TRAP-type transport system small permease protein
MISTFEKVVNKITNILCFLSMGVLVVLLGLSVTDVLGRYLFNHPVKGTYELSEVLLAGIVFFSWPYTKSVQGHVTIDTVIKLFRPRVQAAVGVIVSVLSLVIFILMGWQGIKLALTTWGRQRYIDVVLIPLAPFQLLVPIGSFALCLVVLVQLNNHIREFRKGR